MGNCYSYLESEKTLIINKFSKNKIRNSLINDVQDINIDNLEQWELDIITKLKKNYLQIEILSEEFSGNDNKSKAEYFYNLTSYTEDIELKLGLLLLSLNKDNTNEKIIIEYLKNVKLLQNDQNFNRIYTFYERLLSIESINILNHSNKQKIKSNYEQYFELINEIIAQNSNDLINFIENKKKEFNKMEKYINNNPVNYFNNKEIYFYIQISNFLAFINQYNIFDRQSFLYDYQKVIKYFENNFPEEEKEIESLLLTLNFCKSGDPILKSFKTFINKDLTLSEIKEKILENNLNFINIELKNNNLILTESGKNQLILENFDIYDTYSIVDYFSNNNSIKTHEKLQLIRYNLFQNYNQYKSVEHSLKNLIENYILSSLSYDAFNEIYNYSIPIDYKKYIQNENYINNLLNNKIIIYPFSSKDFYSVTIKSLNKMYISGYTLYYLDNDNYELFKFIQLGKNFVLFIHEYQHLLNSEIAFLTGKIKYFYSNKIGIEESGVEIEKILFGNEIKYISYLQLYYLENYNFNQTISNFRKQFKKYKYLEKKEIDKIIQENNIISFFTGGFNIPIEEIHKNEIIKIKILNTNEPQFIKIRSKNHNLLFNN